MDNILDIRGLKTHFFTEEGIVRAVDGVDIQVERGQVLGIVGESGCGKSVTSLSIMRLVSLPGRILEGAIDFDGEDLVKVPESRMRDIRGNSISMIFQQPRSCLNPVFRIGDQRQRIILQGDVPSPLNPPTGCRFHTRCPLAFDRCSAEEPILKDYGDEHFAACWLLETGQPGASKLSQEAAVR